MRLIARLAYVKLMLTQGDDAWNKSAVLNCGTVDAVAVPLAEYAQQMQAALESRSEKETARLLAAMI